MQSDRYWFPGRWVNGISLIVALPLWLAGTLVRLSLLLPQPLAAATSHPTRIFIAYRLIVAGIVVTAPCSATFVSLGQAHAPSATRFRLTSQAETIVVGTPPWSK